MFVELLENHAEGGLERPPKPRGFGPNLLYCLQKLTSGNRRARDSPVSGEADRGASRGDAEIEGRVCSPRTGFPFPLETTCSPSSLQHKSLGDFAALSSVLGLEIS